MTSDAPLKALVAGGGPAAVEAVLALRDLAPAVDVALLAPDANLTYRPLSTVAPFAHGEVRTYPLAGLTELGVTVHRDALLRVDPAERVVHTDGRQALRYDALLVATGAQMRRAIPRVMTFEGPAYVDAMHGLVRDVEEGYTRSVAFVAPPGASWTLPLYELALQTAERVHAGSLSGVELSVTSHEARPLEALGTGASDLVARLLDAAGVAFRPAPATPPKADRTVALPVPAGRRVPGLPADRAGFLPVDVFCRVPGVERVWGAGDGTTHALKQGGLATQQAEVAAHGIAALAGAAVETPPYQPEVRAMIVTGRGVWYLRRPPGSTETDVSQVPLWEPPTKIAGQRLGPFLDGLDAGAPRANRFERRMAQAPGGHP